MAKKKVINQNGATGGVYFAAYLGAVIYFINQANGFWEVVWAFFQAIVWPAFLVYGAFTAMNI
ncbi:hypothetical protein A3F64_01715 [Candidatus Saccharibacteria bacterium RIFCSPHIGHO2_12_FULL_42_8]|nr:MAG: hypothetical protein A3F64_01715 [Candidatus Saccharibacteria bacterium RIFCSPHIGHO2_12_FULL_42_8]